MGQGRPDEQRRPTQSARVAEIIAAVLETPLADRAAKIETLCADDSALEHEVRSLLRHQSILDDPDHPLSDNAIDALADEYRAYRPGDVSNMSQDGLDGMSVAGYRIIRVLGEGGMGVVYEAEQANPRRRVALKVIDGLRGVNSAHKRLEIEAEILGRLYHPGIAQVYEAGSAPISIGGAPRPFFAMELVADGVPITAYALKKDLDTRARLELMASIADAVDHAHQRAVIHRDLKPDNVLITPEGRPKVLDFGIARVVGDSTLAATAITREGQILGTLAYMAPEQLAGDPTKIGVAADVYALGVIAFELLAKRLPLDLGGLSISAAVRVIEFETPPRLGDVELSLKGDIETIVESCLRREPDRRYGSAAAIATDIRRYLDNKPIFARKPTAGYRTSKFIRRNRIAVLSTILVMCAIVTGILVASLFAIDRQRARITADAERANARLRDIDAVRGVLTSAALLRERDRPWEAVRQMHTVPDSSRGWEWRHNALALPWVIERGSKLNQIETEQSQHYYGFVQSDAILGYTPESSLAWVRDVTTGEHYKVPISDLEISLVRAWKHAPAGQVAVVLRDGQAGALDTATGVFEPWPLAFSERTDGSNWYPMVVASPDTRTIVTWGGTTLTVYFDGSVVFSMDSGRESPRAMNWNPPEFSPDGRWLYLASWGSGGEIITVDTSVWAVHARAAVRGNAPFLSLSHDGSQLYSPTADSGIEVFQTPSLEPLEPIAPEDGWTEGLVLSPKGDRLAAFFVDSQALRVYETSNRKLLFELDAGSVNRNIDLSFSKDGRLILAATPQLRMHWIIDVEHPSATTFTTLRAHGSWIYQLAVSSDGSLLASAAPKGDILLWDLNADRLLARVPRNSDPDQGTTSHNMNAPLVFDQTGNYLLFAEIQPEPWSHGYTQLDLVSGERQRVNTLSYESTLDEIARVIGTDHPAPLFHHAALLGNGRILQSDADGIGEFELVVRQPNENSVEKTVLERTSAKVWTGVAVHPSGEEYAAGEYQTVRIRDSSTNEVRAEITDGVRLPAYGLAYSPDGSRLAMGAEDGRVLMFETEFYKKIAEIELPGEIPDTDRNYAFNVLWTPDGARLITCADSEIRILESQRPFMRDRARTAWLTEIARARKSLEEENIPESVSRAALRVARIEAWAGTQPIESHTEAD